MYSLPTFGSPSEISLFDLPQHEQDKVIALKREFEAIVASGKPARPQLLALAGQGRSLAGLYRLLKNWQEEGDLALVDKRYFSDLWESKRDTVLPEEFLRWVGGQMLGNQRKSKPAYRAILRRWNLWRKTGSSQYAIPGYETPPPVGPRACPVGWSYRNLMSRAQPPAAELCIARIGTAAAKVHLPYIPGTREGLRWLEWVYFDDVWHDRQCVVPGYLRPVRILQLGCLDHATGLYLKFGMRPDLPRDDGTRERLKRRDMLLLVASLLMEHGFPLDYTMHLVVERATATLTAAEARLLYDLSAGQIQVGYTSMDGRFVLSWMEGSSGNAQGKGPLESWHNLLHNEQASLPGQTGKDRDHSPASLYGSDREAVALHKASLLLPAERRGSIQFPYPDFDLAHQQTLEVVARINDRTDHQMEGFCKVALWRIRGTQSDFLPTSALAGIDPQLEPHLEWLSRPESPSERARRLSAGVSMGFVPPGALVRFYQDSHYSAKIKARQASVKVAGKLLIFGPDSPEQMTLPEGTSVDLHFDPLYPSRALVTGGNGLFLGVWPRRLVRRGDQDALASEMRRNQGFLNESVSQVRGKMAEDLAREERRMSANLATLAAADIIPDADFEAPLRARNVVSTPVAQAMQEALHAHRAQAAEERSKERHEASAARFGSALRSTLSESDQGDSMSDPDAPEPEDWSTPSSQLPTSSFQFTPATHNPENDPETW